MTVVSSTVVELVVTACVMLVRDVDVTGRVTVVEGVTAVTVFAVTPMQEHADEKRTSPEQGDA